MSFSHYYFFSQKIVIPENFEEKGCYDQNQNTNNFTRKIPKNHIKRNRYEHQLPNNSNTAVCQITNRILIRKPRIRFNIFICSVWSVVRVFEWIFSKLGYILIKKRRFNQKASIIERIFSILPNSSALIFFAV
jgi:hypothetical protein